MKKGSKQSEESKTKMSESMKGRIPWNKGIPHTEETKKKLKIARNKRITKDETRIKLSIVKRKENLSVETRKKLSLAAKRRKNFKHTEETKEKLRGRKHSKEIRKKISLKTKEAMKKIDLCGSNNPAWKGGISFEPYCEQWIDKQYKNSIKIRDNYKCLNPECNCNNNNDLVIHHIDYIKKNCHPLNLITVCRSSNAKANKDRKWHKAWYQAIINKRYGGVR